MSPGAAGPLVDPTARERVDAVATERARVAVAVVFAANGFAFASWIARLPAVRDALELGTSALGLLLLCGSVGALVALPTSGPLVHRVGPARAVGVGSLLLAAGLVGVSVAVGLASAPLTGAGLFVLGLGMSTWDVAMNVEGADVERRLARPIMPRFHAGFSLGTVAGALGGAGAAGLAVPVAGQLVATAGLVLLAVGAATRSFLPVLPVGPGGTGSGHRASGVWRAWREPRTLVVGLMVLAFAFTEGAANDWIAVALVDGYGASDAVGAVGFGVFVAAMTAARLLGGSALERWGRVRVLRATAALALVGLLLFVAGPSVPWAMAGAVLWGAGAALGFPVGMSAAADEPSRAAVRVSVVSSIGYTAFLAGPPVVGFVAEEVGVVRALLVVLVALVLGLAAAGAARPLDPG